MIAETSQSPLSPLLWGLVLSTVSALVLLSLAYRKFREWGIEQESVEGRRIVQGLGAAIVVSGLATALLGLPFGFGWGKTVLWPHSLLLLFFGLGGALDDLFPDPRGVRGFGGHFGALFLHGRLTRGAAKSILGGAAALYVGLHLGGRSWGEGLLNAVIIAGAANALNLLDVRPGRAVKWWGLAALVPLLSTDTIPFIAPLAIAVLIYAPLDFRRLAMLGDSGALPLGASVGFAWCVLLPDGPAGFTLRAILAVVLVAANVFAEFSSLSRVIRTCPVLEWCDELFVGPLEQRRGESGA